MIIDGRAIAKRIQQRLIGDRGGMAFSPKIALLQVGSHPAIDSFVAIKKRFAEKIGVEMKTVQLPESADTKDVITEIDLLVRSLNPDGQQLYDGLVVQLPLPGHVDTDQVLAAIPRSLDIDVLSPEAQQHMYTDGVLPPVVGAVREVFRSVHVNVREHAVAVIGEGRLVGKPIIDWLVAQGVEPLVVTRDFGDIRTATEQATLIISGTGSPASITPDMVSSKHILIDAGTSESGGQVVGDVDPACGNIVRYLTPVPGGIGPITVAILFQNLFFRLQSKKDELE